MSRNVSMLTIVTENACTPLYCYYKVGRFVGAGYFETTPPPDRTGAKRSSGIKSKAAWVVAQGTMLKLPNPLIKTVG